MWFAGEEEPQILFGQLKKFSLRELQVATDSFNAGNILGRGGFGKVYKGRLADGTLVAVKRLKEERSQGGELQFQMELEIISLAVHRNLLKLLGFCSTLTERLLVYPYMANGSVASRLRGTTLQSSYSRLPSILFELDPPLNHSPFPVNSQQLRAEIHSPNSDGLSGSRSHLGQRGD